MRQEIRGVLFDLDGVLFHRHTILPMVIDVLNKLSRANFPFRILSNITLLSKKTILEKFLESKLYFPSDWLLTPSTVACSWLKQHKEPAISLFVSPTLRDDFDGLHILSETAESGADFVLLGEMVDNWNAYALNRALRLILNGAQLVGLGMGHNWISAEGMRLDVGAYVTALEYASKKKATIFGKPSPDYFRIALQQMELEPEGVLMVGDDIVTDIFGAQQVSLRTALVQTGRFRETDLHSGIKPDWIIPDVSHILNIVNM